MTTRFGELNEFFDPGLEFTVQGRAYRVDPPSGKVGLWLQKLAIAAGNAREAKTDTEMAAAAERAEAVALADPNNDLTLEQQVLGGTYDQLVADDVDHVRIKFLARTAYIWIVADEAAALRYWNSGGHPEAEAPNRQERRASRSTGGAASTRQRGSTSGTTSRPTKSPARVRRSAGTKS